MRDNLVVAREMPQQNNKVRETPGGKCEGSESGASLVMNIWRHCRARPRHARGVRCQARCEYTARAYTQAINPIAPAAKPSARILVTTETDARTIEISNAPDVNS